MSTEGERRFRAAGYIFGERLYLEARRLHINRSAATTHGSGETNAGLPPGTPPARGDRAVLTTNAVAVVERAAPEPPDDPHARPSVVNDSLEGDVIRCEATSIQPRGKQRSRAESKRHHRQTARADGQAVAWIQQAYRVVTE